MDLSRRTLFRYALQGLPLGFIGLPLYVHLPKFYADTMPATLAGIGGVLFFARLIDCLADPWIGYWADRHPAYRRVSMRLAGIAMALGVLGLFYLPSVSLAYPLLGVAALLVLTYLAYSVLMIQFYAAGLSLAQNAQQTVQVSAWREAMVMVGVLLASILPSGWMQQVGEQSAYHYFAWSFVAVLLLTSRFSLLPADPRETVSAPANPRRSLRAQPALRWVFALFFLNAIPPAVTATLFLFFVTDRLQEANFAGAFLLAYFLSAMAAMPCWVVAARVLGKRRALAAAMVMAIGSFMGTVLLGSGDSLLFLVICIASGAALGGDLAILPSLLADVIPPQQRGGIEFGLWNFISKFTLALAAGIALPVLGLLGYIPGHVDTQSAQALAFSYAVLPCLFKLLALALLLFSPIARTERPV